MKLTAAVVALALLVSVPAAAQDKLTILSTSLPDANCGVPYLATLNAGGGNVATRRWSIIDGRLPRRLTFTVNAKLWGTPEEAGSFPIVFRVEDGEGEFDERRYVIQVEGAPECPEGSGGRSGASGSGGSNSGGGSGGTADSMGGGIAGPTGAGAGGGSGWNTGGGGPGVGASGDSFRGVNRAPAGCDCDASSGGPGAIALLALALRRRR